LGPEDGKARKIPLTGYFIWQVQQNNALNELADPFYYSTQGAVLRRSRHAFILLLEGSAPVLSNLRTGAIGSMERSEATLSQLSSQRRSSLRLKLTGPSPSQ